MAVATAGPPDEASADFDENMRSILQERAKLERDYEDLKRHQEREIAHQLSIL